MLIRIKIRQRIEGEVGTVCEVSPDRASFLLSCGAAEPVTEEQSKPAKKKSKGK